MQKSEFADHLVLKCQIQPARFADRRKIIPETSETAGDRDPMVRGWGVGGAESVQTSLDPTQPNLQMNQLEMLDERLPQGRLKTAVKFGCEGPCALRGTQMDVAHLQGSVIQSSTAPSLNFYSLSLIGSESLHVNLHATH